MKTMEQFCKDNRIKITSEPVNNNPNMFDFVGNHYKVTLKFDGRQMTIIFSQGYGIKRFPIVEDVLSCLVSESDVENHDFGEWCDNLGYDRYDEYEGKRARDTYRLCQKRTERFKRFMGDKFEEILYNTEPY